MNYKKITAAKANSSFPKLLDRVYYKQESFQITHDNKVIAELVPVEIKSKGFPIHQLNDFFKKLPRLGLDAIHFANDLEKIRSSIQKRKSDANN